MLKVCKFGGTSMANAENIRKSAEIVKSDYSRRFVVVSAPGKRNKTDDKITDLLIRCSEEVKKKGTYKDTFLKVRERFEEIISALGIDLKLEKEFDETLNNIQKGANLDYAASRGEYFCAKIFAKFLGFEFIDAKDIIFFDEQFDAKKTDRVCSKTLSKVNNAVIPGFYGIDTNGKIKTFSRGGSDVTGSIIAKAVKCDIYENWTDVNGFMTADPRIVKNPKSIKILSYSELRELSYMGASVLHPESIFPVKDSKIPINIRNTFEKDNIGTTIVPDSNDILHEDILTGIAGKKDFTVILVEKDMMNSERGFARKVLTAIEECGVSFEHLPTGIDSMSVVISDCELKDNKLEKIVAKIKKYVNPDKVEIFDKLALIAIVGSNMREKCGTAAKLFNAVAKAGINIRMIDQGSSELNIIIGIDNNDYENCIRAIYDEFYS